MLLKPARKGAPGRKVPPPQPQSAKVHTFPAPVRGWVTNEALASAKPGAALVMENFFPTENGMRVRGGLLKYATIHASSSVNALMAYKSASASALFAALAGSIFDISNPASPTTIPTASLTGQTNADYSWSNMSTAGGEFLIAVNGTDRMVYYDGSTWRRVDEATTELPYDTQTVNFGAPPMTITGGTSGATGVLVEDIDNGATGTLRLKTVVGTFQDNETITGTTGSAKANIPSGVTTVPAITGSATTALSALWLFKSRVFFVKKNSLTAYYLPVDSIGGALGTLSLQGIFKRGGKLLFGATYSSDAGDGPDDFCVFVSDQGEVAGYQGNNPGSATDWQLIGVWDISEPLHKNAHMKAGGDLLIATKTGLIPLSGVFNKDIAAIGLIAVSRPIEPNWRYLAANFPGTWGISKNPDANMAIVSYPYDESGIYSNLAINLQTGAWARFTGWDCNSTVEFNGHIYIGTSSGWIGKAEANGSDNGEIYSCTYVGLHESIAGVTQEVVAHMARSTWKYATDFNYKVSFAFDYDYTLGAFPDVANVTSSDVWDTGIWGTAIWDGTNVTRIATQWQGMGGRGFAIAPMVQISMGITAVPNIELVSINLAYEQGNIVS